MPLTSWTQMLGISARRARYAIQQGHVEALRLPEGGRVERTATGRYEVVVPLAASHTCALYARVAHRELESLLDEQMAVLRVWAQQRGLQVVGELAEMRPLFEPSPALEALIANQTIDVVAVVTRDRMGLAGAPLLASALAGQGRELVVLSGVTILCVRDYLMELEQWQQFTRQRIEQVRGEVDARLPREGSAMRALMRQYGVISESPPEDPPKLPVVVSLVMALWEGVWMVGCWAMGG